MTRCLIVAETGLNHNGSLATAHAMVDAIAEAGADAAKFQCYSTDDFIGDRTLTYQGRSQYEMFKACELPDSAWAELQAHCNEVGIVFFATPTSVERVAMLAEMGVPLLKNGSDYLGHLPLIRAMGETGIKTVLSTGMATEEEITDAVRTFKQAGGRELVLLHCTSNYPTAPPDVNLRRMRTLAARYAVPVGLSDHTDGSDHTAAIGAVVLGAVMVEKHFTLGRLQPGPDHRFSTNQVGLRELVESIRGAEQMLGNPKIGPADTERQARAGYRLSCVAARDLPAGHRLEVADIAFRRPGTGLAPKHARGIVGRTLLAPLTAGEVFE